MELRSYQKQAASEALETLAADPASSPLLVLPTGAGKTVIMGNLTETLQGRSVQAAIAHRRELVSQIALAYARYGIPHRIVGPETTVREARAAQLSELGRSLINQNAPVGVCSVDTLVARKSDPWFAQVTHAHWDEAHHVLASNKWGRARELFPNLKHSIGYTATPKRADRKGLDSVFTRLILGPSMRDLIEWGFLTDYRLITGEVTDLDLSSVATSTDGDYNPQQLRTAMKRSRQVVGDAVATYRKYCDGVRAVLFACDVEDACRYRDAFNAAGIPAEVVTANTDPGLRREAINKLRAGELKILINVDLFGEGFDLPAIECVVMCRPTKSLPLYHQQFGRALRLVIDKALMKQWDSFTSEERLAYIAASAKPKAVIIDLVKNWAQPECGGLPDARGRTWTLTGAAKRQSSAEDAIPLRACQNPHGLDSWQALGPDLQSLVNASYPSHPKLGEGEGLCTSAYERYLSRCPVCGWSPIPQGRTIEQVDGDPSELDAETLAKLRGEVAAAIATPNFYGDYSAANYKRHAEKVYALEALKKSMTYFGPAFAQIQRRELSDAEQAKAFYLTFGVDVFSAQTLKRAEADALKNKVLDWLAVKGFTIPE